MQEQFEEISTLAPFTAHRVTLVDDIGDGHVGRRSMKFQESFNKHSVDVNDE
jgi:hypothetical protein